MVFHSLLNHNFNHYRPRRTTDGQGGWSTDYVLQGSLLGRIRPATSQERIEAMQQQREITHVLYLEWGADIGRGDLVQLGALVAEILGVREPSQAREHLEIDCRETQQDVTLEEGS